MPSERAWKERRERSLINEPDQKAMIYFHDGIEQLVISPGFDGAVGDFAWVVPVPARPKVEVLEGAPFHELARLVAPVPPRYMSAAKAANRGVPMGGVTVLERRNVGDYDVSVLESTDADALLKWLRENHYHLPDKAEAPMRYYIDERWTFVACRIKDVASAGVQHTGLWKSQGSDVSSGQQPATALHNGTLTPLRLIFPARHPIYPMRLSSANPEPFTVLTYLIVPDRMVHRLDYELSTLSAPENRIAAMMQVGTIGPLQRAQFPTLAKLSKTDLKVYLLQAKFRPQECTRDFVWDLPRGLTRQ